MSLLGIEVGRRLKEAGSELKGFLVGATRVLHMEVEVYLLLLGPSGPLGCNVVHGELHADTPLSGCVKDAVPVVIPNDVPTEDPRPECALGFEVGGVKHDDVSDHLHGRNFTRDRGAG